MVFATFLMLSVTPAHAESPLPRPPSVCVPCLGTPSNALPGYGRPLGQFRRAGPVLRRFGRLELLQIGSRHDPWSGVERWAIVKALAQFGAWSGVTPLAGATRGFGRDVPSFDFSHARYSSPLVWFVYHDRGDRGLSAQERAYFERYVLGGPEAGGPTLVMLGGYVMKGAGIPVAALRDPAGHALSFVAVQRALQHGGRAPFVHDIDAETNLLTALICHADRRRPVAVCRRPVIARILRSIR